MDRQGLLERVCQDEFKGYEVHAAKRLHAKLPKSYYSSDFEDVLGWVRVWALEAVNLYRDDRNAAFPTFLYKHLQLRSFQEVNWAWASKEHPEGCFVACFSAYETDDDLSCIDPALPEEDPSFNLQIAEFTSLLSQDSQEVWQRLRDAVRDAVCGDEVLRLLGLSRRIRPLARLLDVDEISLHRFFSEISEVPQVAIP